VSPIEEKSGDHVEIVRPIVGERASEALKAIDERRATPRSSRRVRVG
jgi:hypothetical protein